jgi:AcrR family transcriptional regulator
LYLYFKNKDELYASLSLRILQYLNIRLEHVSDEKDLSSEHKVQSLKSAMYDVYKFDPLVLLNLFHLQSSETLKNLSSDLLDEIKDLSRKSLGTMAKIVEEGVSKGIFVDRHPLAIADIIWAMFSGIVLLEESKKLIQKEDNYLEQTLDTAFEIFARGIKK